MTEPWDALVVVGIIARPHGLRGDLVIRPETDFPEARFAPGAMLWINPATGLEALVVKTSRTHLGRPLVTFVGRDGIDAVEALAGLELRVPESALTPLGEGEYYWYRLVGAPVVTDEGVDVGPVVRVEPTGGAGVLVVAGRTGEVQIPLARDICTTLTPERIVVRAPEGLLELNAPAERRREDRHRHHLSRDDRRGAAGRRHGTGGPARAD